MAYRLAAGPVSVPTVVRQDRRRWWNLFVVLTVLVFSTAAVAAMLTPGGGSLRTAQMTLAAAGLLLVSIWVIARPAHGVHLMVLFTLIGDNQTLWWYPATKNFSSAESVLYVSDRLIINPLEVLLVLTTVSWLARRRTDPAWNFVRGGLLKPIVVFGALVVVGLLYGVGRSGDRTAALWEARPLFYLPIVYILATNLFKSSRDYVWAMWLAMIAVTVQSVLALSHYFGLDAMERAGREDLTEHAASVPINAMIILLLAIWLLPRCSIVMRSLLPLMAIPTIWAYFIAERRSAFVGLALGIILLSVTLFQLNRRVFWVFVPVVALVGTVYVAAFWNAEGALSFPAQAIKSAIAPGQLEGKDQSSNIYRELEGRNVWFTLRSRPLTGVGFGHVFYQLYALPNISFFRFWQFMPHHSFLWIWLKMGFIGFVSMIFLIIRTIQHGVRTVFRVRPGTDQAVALTAVLFVVMYVVFSYVDIAWDMRSTVMLGLCMAICADMPSEIAPPAVLGTNRRDKPELVSVNSSAR
jgi:O-Antigen ligase